jgi:2-haloacid dehalogenase
MSNTTERTSKNLIFDLGHVIFNYDPQFVDELFERAPDQVFNLMPDGFALLQACRAQKKNDGSPLHKLFVLSNASQRALDIMHIYFPHVLAYFDEIMASAHVGMQKPDIRIYHHFLQTYKLDPTECIFIDDKTANVLSARNAQINGIVYNDPVAVKKQLHDLGVLDFF